MFNRLRNAASVLRGNRRHPTKGGPHPERVRAEVEEYRLYQDRLGELPPPEGKNPGVMLLEALVTVALVGFVVFPLTHWLLSTVTEKGQAILNSIVSIGVYQILDRVTSNLNIHGKLDFLNPYLGKRLRRTIAVFRG